jgi:hypothetical protein
MCNLSVALGVLIFSTLVIICCITDDGWTDPWDW